MTLRAASCFFRATDGALIHFDLEDAPVPARGACVTVHGLGEHLGKYAEWGAYLQSRGYHATAYDQRGHGRTSGGRGDFHFADLVDDLARFVAVTADRYAGLPIVLTGHSLGALVVMRYAAGVAGAVHPMVRGAALSSPPLDLLREYPGWYQWGVKVLARTAPGMRLPRATDPARLTRDPERAATFAADPLIHRVISPRAMLEAADAMAAARAAPEAVALPLLVLVAGADSVVSVPAAVAWTEAAGADRTIEQIPGAFHEILNDLGRQATFARIGDWCDARL
ncbi:MAG: lysophospholipase [Gemmatimonadota bacterium]